MRGWRCRWRRRGEKEWTWTGSAWICDRVRAQRFHGLGERAMSDGSHSEAKASQPASQLRRILPARVSLSLSLSLPNRPAGNSSHCAVCCTVFSSSPSHEDGNFRAPGWPGIPIWARISNCSPRHHLNFSSSPTYNQCALLNCVHRAAVPFEIHLAGPGLALPRCAALWGHRICNPANTRVLHPSRQRQPLRLANQGLSKTPESSSLARYNPTPAVTLAACHPRT